MTDTEATIRRSFPATLTRSGADQRTLGGRCVPYNIPATVSDNGGPAYREMFVRGAFRQHLSAPNRVELTYRHGDGLLDRIGHATQLEERDDGLWGMFRVRDGVVGDQALSLVDDGFLPGLSVAGTPRRQTRSADGVVVRQQVFLTAVGLCEEPAYAGAVVSVRRTRSELQLPERPSDEQLARLAAVGIRVGR
jgi:HK97 family phage prohead protease